MYFIRLLISIAAGVSLLGACTDRASKSASPSQATQSQPRGSKMMEYRAALNAYSTDRREAALAHFRAAAEQGHVDAQYYTGLMYANGEGTTTRNYKEAARWYQMAAQRNQPDALYQLARLHATGSGVKMDVEKAAELFDSAARLLPEGEKKQQAVEQRDALKSILAARPDAAAAATTQ